MDLPDKLRILQVHPTSRCNLSCRQCYSWSGPRAAGALGLEEICRCVTDAHAIGYHALSVAGGEPLLWPQLPELLEHAKGLGMTTAITTNGTLITERRAGPLMALVDLVAVSCDGPPEVHEELRGRGTWTRLLRGIALLRDIGATWGLAYSVGRRSWDWLPTIAGLVAREGGRLLQLHPLEAAGRAATGLDDHLPDEEALSGTVILAGLLSVMYSGQMAVQLDLVARERLGALFAGDCARLPESLCLEADGTLVPYSYGVARHLAVCRIPHERLADAFTRYQEGIAPRVERVKQMAALRAARRPRRFVSAYEELVAASLLHGEPEPADLAVGAVA